MIHDNDGTYDRPRIIHINHRAKSSAVDSTSYPPLKEAYGGFTPLQKATVLPQHPYTGPPGQLH